MIFPSGDGKGKKLGPDVGTLGFYMHTSKYIDLFQIVALELDSRFTT